MKAIVGVLGLVMTFVVGMAVSKQDETAGGVAFIAGLVITALAVLKA